MNFFCRIFGHTWWPEVDVPEHRWNTTKDGDILTSTVGSSPVRHFESCRRCATQRDLPARRHDGDGLQAEGEAAPEA